MSHHASWIKFPLLLAVIGPAAITQAEMGPPRVIEPTTFAAPAGHYKLWRNPSHPLGEGSTTYLLSRDGQPLWTKHLNFALLEASVDDFGRTGGYAFQPEARGPGKFEVVLMGGGGALLVDELHDRTPSGFVDGPFLPYGRGVLMDEANDRMIVRAAVTKDHEIGEEWWCYSLATGKRLATLPPAKAGGEEGHFIVDAEPVPGTALILIDWWDFSDDKMGAIFTLVDRDAKPVWTLKMAGDYQITGSEVAQDALRSMMQDRGAILGTALNGQFDLALVKQGMRVTYQAKPDASGWHVSAIGAKPYDPLRKEPKPRFVPREVPLKLIRKWAVPVVRGGLSPMRDVDSFAFAGPKRIALVRGGDHPALLIARMTGKIEHVFRLPPEDPEHSETRLVAHVGGSNLVFVRSPGSPAQAKAWTVDALTGSMKPLAKFSSPSVKGVAGFRDGSFAVIATNEQRYTESSEIQVCSPDGSRKWILSGAGYSDNPGEVKDPDDVAVDSQQRLIVLNTIFGVQYFSKTGRFLSSFEFKDGPDKPEYATKVEPMLDGTLELLDNVNGQEGFRHLTSGGHVTAAHRLRYQDGKLVEYCACLRQDAAGQTWMSDREGIFRIDSAGRIVASLGPRPPSVGLSEVEGLNVNPQGSVVAVDHADGQVFYFWPTGILAHVGKPLPKDYAQHPPQTGPVQVTRSDDVYVGASSFGFSMFGPTIHYSPAGQRIGVIKITDHPSPNESPSSTSRWEAERLVDPLGRVITTLDRWPDLHWMLEGPTAVAPNGSLMSIGAVGSPLYGLEPDRIAFFTPSGKPEGLKSLPAGLGQTTVCAYDGKLAFIERKGGIVAFDKQGKALWEFKIPTKPGRYWEIFPSRGGLALWDEQQTVYWYALPK